jgi:hypothetical protein
MDDLDEYVNKCYRRTDGFKKIEYIDSLAKLFRFKLNEDGNIEMPPMIEFNFKYLARTKPSYMRRHQFEGLYLDLHLVNKLFQNSPYLSGLSMMRIIKILSNNNDGFPIELTIGTIYNVGDDITNTTDIMGFIKLHDSLFTLRARTKMLIRETQGQQQQYNNGNKGYLGRVAQMQMNTTHTFDVNYTGSEQTQAHDQSLFDTVVRIAERVSFIEGQMNEKDKRMPQGHRMMQSFVPVRDSLINISPIRRQSPDARKNIETSPVSIPPNRQLSPPIVQQRRNPTPDQQQPPIQQQYQPLQQPQMFRTQQHVLYSPDTYTPTHIFSVLNDDDMSEYEYPNQINPLHAQYPYVAHNTNQGTNVIPPMRQPINTSPVYRPFDDLNRYAPYQQNQKK